jgi:hypothetical protein
MRELQLYPPKRPRLPDIVRRLQFVANGSTLVAWVDHRQSNARARPFHRKLGVYACDLAGGESRRIDSEMLYDIWGEPASDPAVTPDGRYLLTEVAIEGHHSNMLCLTDLQQPDEQGPEIATTPIGFPGMFFTADGKEMIAARNGLEFDDPDRDLVRLGMAPLTGPPERFVMRRNPFTGAGMRVPVRNFRWKPVLVDPPWARANTAALSTDGRLLAVGDVKGGAHVVDLKKKEVLVSFPPEERVKLPAASCVALDPAAKRLVRLVGNRLFAHRLDGGKGWETKSSLGSIYGFAFHPSGHFICATFGDGQARYLDALTGKVQQAFKWFKRLRTLWSVAFAPDGLTCAAGGENGKVVVWDVDV